MELEIQGGQDRTEFVEQRITGERATKKKKSLIFSAEYGLAHTIRMRKKTQVKKRTIQKNLGKQ